MKVNEIRQNRDVNITSVQSGKSTLLFVLFTPSISNHNVPKPTADQRRHKSRSKIKVKGKIKNIGYPLSWCGYSCRQILSCNMQLSIFYIIFISIIYRLFYNVLFFG